MNENRVQNAPVVFRSHYNERERKTQESVKRRKIVFFGNREAPETAQKTATCGKNVLKNSKIKHCFRY